MTASLINTARIRLFIFNLSSHSTIRQGWVQGQGHKPRIVIKSSLNFYSASA